ncbi:MAG: desulfoferrodoxin [Candidatus Nanoarchaeia archaeon]|nr:desulfoferrodoxin [Candidatus Nanoarchaeia archaeon]
MTKIGEIYKCEICGNVVSVVEAGGGTLVCCGEDMVLLKAKLKESEGKEKHVPIIENKSNNVLVKVGSIDHPMIEEHYISLIQIFKGDKLTSEKKLYPGERPEAEFFIKYDKNLKARVYCNIHGLWTS